MRSGPWPALDRETLLDVFDRDEPKGSKYISMSDLQKRVGGWGRTNSGPSYCGRGRCSSGRYCTMGW